MTPAIFLDRDGVILTYHRLLTNADEMVIAPGVPEALRKLKRAGYLLVVITNQSVVARGMITEEELRKLHRTLTERLETEGVALDRIYYCPHHPDADIPEYRTVCECRKPGILLIQQAVKELDIDLSRSFFIGDEATDIEAGVRAKVKTIFIGTDPDMPPGYIAKDLSEAALIILGGA